jgi:hypothetical protein
MRSPTRSGLDNLACVLDTDQYGNMLSIARVCGVERLGLPDPPLEQSG